MRALTCPKCGAPVQAETPVCPYCGVGLVDDHPMTDLPPREPPAVQIPEGWTLTRDGWHGFSIAHPLGWQVVTTKGQISVREDPVGRVAALIWPFSLPGPVHARQVALQFTGMARSLNPSFQAWQQNTADDSNRVTVRTRQMRLGQSFDGCFNILVQGSNAIVSGYEAPTQVVAERGPIMAQILSTFRTAELMPRQWVQEPMEGAYSAAIPAGWSFQGGVNRNNIGGSGSVSFSTGRDPQFQVGAAMPWYHWNYMDGWGGFMGAMGGYQAMRYTPAAQYAAQQVAPWMGRSLKELKVEAVIDRPDLAEFFQRDLLEAGYLPGMFEIQTAMLETTHTENGVRLRQKARVSTQRQMGGGGLMSGVMPMWVATMDIYYRAPDLEFAEWEPVLAGILDSLKMNPAWQMGERRLAQNYIANSQADTQRRLHQISQTLSETTDIITSGYWNRQQTYDRISEARSNATLGVQNVTSASGDVYKVPNGFDQYWVDGLGNLYGGSWMSQPEINWTPLTPTGI